jgi:hypothetical protein
MKLNKIFMGLIIILILFACDDKKSNCDPTKYSILDESVSGSDEGSEYTYDIEFSDFDETCVSEVSVRDMLRKLIQKQKLRFPVTLIRCFKHNGGGFINDASSPAGDDDLMFLLIRDIDSASLSFDYEIRRG